MNLHFSSEFVHLLVCYCAGLVLAWGMATVWFRSNLLFYLLDHRLVRVFGTPSCSREDFLARASAIWGRKADLLSCVPCGSTWLSLIASGVVHLALGSPWWFIPLGLFWYTGWLHRLLK